MGNKTGKSLVLFHIVEVQLVNVDVAMEPHATEVSFEEEAVSDTEELVPEADDLGDWPAGEGLEGLEGCAARGSGAGATWLGRTLVCAVHGPENTRTSAH